jgi:hypothetical protein
MRAFPLNAPGVRLSATATTARVALPSAGGGTLFENVRVVNAGPNQAWLAGGDSTIVAAVPTGTPSINSAVLPGEDVVFTLPAGVTNIAAICAAGGTAQLDISVAEGW